jgi:hypothetical protein
MRLLLENSNDFGKTTKILSAEKLYDTVELEIISKLNDESVISINKINLDKIELGEFIGGLLHLQSKFRK